MAAGKCGCAGTTCSCVIKGDGVTGAGSVNNPYIITAGVVLRANSTATINHTLLGDGSPANPWTLTSVATLELGDLTDVDASITSTGYVPARQADGSFAMVPPSTAPVGAISAGNSIEGDGSGGDPLDVRLAALSGLVVLSGGLALDPHTVTSEADLDTDFGALPVGSIVSDTDGTGVWVKSGSGWSVIHEDTGWVTTVGGNVSAASGWSIDLVRLRRRNGVVMFSLGVTTLINRTAPAGNGNVGNDDVATVIPAKFRPATPTPLRILSGGDDASWYISSTGIVYLTNAMPGFLHNAGYQWNFGGTYLGA